jgi:hypothetical protein
MSKCSAKLVSAWTVAGAPKLVSATRALAEGGGAAV